MQMITACYDNRKNNFIYSRHMQFQISAPNFRGSADLAFPSPWICSLIRAYIHKKNLYGAHKNNSL